MREGGSNITSKHIYIIIRENRNGYKDKLQHHFGVTSHNKSGNDTSYSEDTVMHTSTSSVTLDKKTFGIIISAEKWQIIKPKKRYIKTAYIGLYNLVGQTL